MGLTIKLDVEETETTLVRFLRDYTAAAHAQGAVIGLSGGLDSAVVAALAVRALDADHVHGFALPSASSDQRDTADARLVAEHLGIDFEEHPIQPIVDHITQTVFPDADPDRGIVANVMARARMVTLYAEAQQRGCLVLGTGNKSELLTGYFTKYGDGGSDVLPIGDLYKTQVRDLAAHLDIPRRIIDKAPSAGLWSGQTDELELGLSYDALDRILLGLEIGLDDDRIAGEAGVDLSEVHRIEHMRRQTQHKRQAPPVCKLGIRTIGTDWRDPLQGTTTPEA